MGVVLHSDQECRAIGLSRVLSCPCLIGFVAKEAHSAVPFLLSFNFFDFPPRLCYFHSVHSFLSLRGRKEFLGKEVSLSSPRSCYGTISLEIAPVQSLFSSLIRW